jgi:hypothetical protein
MAGTWAQEASPVNNTSKEKSIFFMIGFFLDGVKVGYGLKTKGTDQKQG